MVVATVAIAPLGIATGGTRLLEPRALMIGLAVAMLSAATPFALEIHALRAVSPRTFGVLMSTSPAVAGTDGLARSQRDARMVAGSGDRVRRGSKHRHDVATASTAVDAITKSPLTPDVS